MLSQAEWLHFHMADEIYGGIFGKDTNHLVMCVECVEVKCNLRFG